MGQARTPPRSGSDAGFTLAELLVAVAILITVLVGVLGALSASATSSVWSLQRARALTLANQRIELARNTPYDEIGVHAADGEQLPAGQIPGVIEATVKVDGYTVATSVVKLDDRHGNIYKRVSITVFLPEPRDASSVSASTAIFGQGKQTGALEVTVVEWPTLQPLEDAQIVVTNTQTGKTYQQDSYAGKATFYDLPVSDTLHSTDYQVSISKSSPFYLFDPALPTVTVSWNLQRKYGPVRGERPNCQASITVQDSQGPLQGARVWLSRADRPSANAYTDSSGVADFTGLYTGSYDISVEGASTGSPPPTVVLDTSAWGGPPVPKTVTLQ